MGARTRNRRAKAEGESTGSKEQSNGAVVENQPSADPRQSSVGCEQSEAKYTVEGKGTCAAENGSKQVTESYGAANEGTRVDARTAYQRMMEDGPLAWSGTYTASKDAKFEYLAFTRRLRHPQCKEVTSSIAEHIGTMNCAASSGASPDVLAHMLHDFLDNSFMPSIRENPVWRFAAEAALSRAHAAGNAKNAACACEGGVCTGEYCEIEFLGREGGEYIIMNRLHRAAFNRDADDRAEDARIDRAIALHHAWIEPCHLEIPPGILCPLVPSEKGDTSGTSSVPGESQAGNFNKDIINSDGKRTEFIAHKSGLPAQALFELRRVNAYTTPRDKMVCLLNGVRLVHMTVAKAADADTLMPVLIFALIKARVGRLHANLQYVRRFRSPARLASEAYSLTCLEAAASFIANMSAESLAISADEYAERVQPYSELTFSASPLSPLSQGADSGRSSTGSSPPVLDQAEAVLRNVQEKISRSASRSMDYIGRMLDRAEDHMRTKGWLRDSDDEISGRASAKSQACLSDNEDAFQMQLAMALSLSEMEAHGASVAGIDSGDEADGRSSPEDADGKLPATC